MENNDSINFFLELVTFLKLLTFRLYVIYIPS